MTNKNSEGVEKSIRGKVMACWLLRRAGHSREAVAQELLVTVRTIGRWDKEAKDFVDELPSAQLAIDHLQTLIPKAMEVLEEALTGLDARLASEIACKILISKNVVKDRKHIEIAHDDTNATDEELIAESNKIISQARDILAEAPYRDLDSLDGEEGTSSNES